MSVPTINNIQTFVEGLTTNRTIADYTPSAGAGGKLIVGLLAKDNGGTLAIDSVTYDGNALTEITGAHIGTTFNNEFRVFYLDNPLGLAASGDVAVNVNDATEILGLMFYAFTVLGAKTGTPTGAEVGINTISAVTMEQAVTPAQDDTLVISFMGSGGGNAFNDATPPHTELDELNLSGSSTNSSLSLGFEDVETAEEIPVEWATDDVDNRNCLMVVALAPTPPAAGTILPHMMQYSA